MTMRTICFLPAFLVLTIFCRGQEFNPRFSLALDDTLVFHTLEWIDIDNDGMLDVLGFASNAQSEETLFFVKNDTTNGFSFRTHLNTKVKNAAHLLTDFDGDNTIDLLISGTINSQRVTLAYINKGGFIFEPLAVINEAGAVIRYEDLNLDGHRDLLLSGSSLAGSFIKIYDHSGSEWKVVHDTIAVAAHDMKILDFDNDQDADFFVSGKDEQGNLVNRFYYNEHNLYFKEQNYSSPILGQLIQGDLNADGRTDMVLSGKDVHNVSRTLLFRNTLSGFITVDTLAGLHDVKLFAADFNSDGICDLSVNGFEIDDDTVNVILRANGRDIIFHKNLVRQRFGDYDKDGDLDQLLLLKTTSGYALSLHENITSKKNLPPRPPHNPSTATIFDRLFIYWEKAEDDHTPTPAITYDVFIQSTADNVMTAQFDLVNGERLLVSQGNNGTTNYSLTKVHEQGRFTFNIQSVDNAFYAGGEGVCKGQGGHDTGGCDEFEIVNMDACRNEMITLAGEDGSMWFSFAKGLISESAVYSFSVQRPDTIFSFNPKVADCGIQVFIVNTPPVVTKITEAVQYACAGQIFSAGVETGWPVVEWRSVLLGFISNEDSIEYRVSLPDTLTVKISNGTGCDIQRNTVVRISKPELEITEDGYQILKGESVQLSASSGGTEYWWTPDRGLSRPDIRNPVASPLITTEYTVTVYDSVGCSAKGRIIVIVEETAFIPNLFTPNEDGKNDALKIYGLGTVSSFSFSIYNREGTLVYDTKNVAEATTQGWNGTTRGTNLPPGVYHWKISGEAGSGKRLQLNGKNSGTVVLLR
jgi:gliding motility-associated-like protein